LFIPWFLLAFDPIILNTKNKTGSNYLLLISLPLHPGPSISLLPSGDCRGHRFAIIVTSASVDRYGATAAKTRVPTSPKIIAVRTTIVTQGQRYNPIENQTETFPNSWSRNIRFDSGSKSV
jgi:hypothetical protein